MWKLAEVTVAPASHGSVELNAPASLHTHLVAGLCRYVKLSWWFSLRIISLLCLRACSWLLCLAEWLPWGTVCSQRSGDGVELQYFARRAGICRPPWLVTIRAWSRVAADLCPTILYLWSHFSGHSRSYLWLAATGSVNADWESFSQL